MRGRELVEAPFLPAVSRPYTSPVPARQFDADTAFAALLDRRPGVALVDVLAEIAVDLDRQHHTFDLAAWLDEEEEALADLVRPNVAAAADPVETCVALFEALGGRHGLGRRPADYNDYRSSVVRHVVQTGRGLPIVVCILAAELGRRLGLDLSGASTPGHFLLRLETDHGYVLVDAYRGGWILQPDEAVEWIAQTTGYPQDLIVPALKPTTPRLTIIRVLENLKRQLVDAQDWPRAYHVQTRLLALRPGQRSDQVDLAAIAAHGPNPNWALKTLGMLTADASQAERKRLLQISRVAKRSLVGWN